MVSGGENSIAANIVENEKLPEITAIK